MIHSPGTKKWDDDTDEEVTSLEVEVDAFDEHVGWVVSFTTEANGDDKTWQVFTARPELAREIAAHIVACAEAIERGEE